MENWTDREGAVDCLQAVQEDDVDDRLLSAKQVAERLGLSPLTVAEMMRDGRLPAVKLGRLPRVRTSDLDAYIAALPAMEPHKSKTQTAALPKEDTPSTGEV